MRRTWLFVLVIAPLLAAAPAWAQKRVALVIGNSAYEHTTKLDNPANDAVDMTAALRALGFEVIDGFDLGKTAFERKVRDFSTALRSADVGLFFYAGHGLQVAGLNYLVPVDAKAETTDALDWEMVRLDLVQRTMERATATNIIFLDACRNNPLSRNLARAMGTRSTDIGRGLAAVESGVGTLVAFSTQPGNVALDGRGRNSPFAGSLVRRISKSSDDLSAILIDVRNDVRKETQNAQVPWEHSALTGRFYFKPLPASDSKPEAAPAAVSEAAQSWALVKDSEDVRTLEAFRRQYGVSHPLFDRLAEIRIETLRQASARETSLPPPRSQPAPPVSGPLAGYEIDRQASVTGVILSSTHVRIDASKPEPAIENCAQLCTTSIGCVAFDLSVVYGKCTLYRSVDRKSALGGYISGTRRSR